ncbi:hypothetical protein TWF173_002618 [Orbilia oligospora]|nr:hypothetical protein TWF173_002618 [Orbilia oligospora]
MADPTDLKELEAVAANQTDFKQPLAHYDTVPDEYSPEDDTTREGMIKRDMWLEKIETKRVHLAWQQQCFF